MGVAQKNSKALRKMKSTTRKQVSSLPAESLIDAVVEQINEFENGIKQAVIGVQDKVKALQANLQKMVQANKALERENRELRKARTKK